MRTTPRGVHRGSNRGVKEVVDADLSGYFDTIPHPQLLKSLARRISDGSLMRLLKSSGCRCRWRKSDGRGGKRRSKSGPAPKTGHSARGTDFPAVKQPLHEALRAGVEKPRLRRARQARIVNYADDFVILCRKSGEQAYTAMSALMGQLGLRVNTEKTRLCKVPEESFDFLGYRFGRCSRPSTDGNISVRNPARRRLPGLSSELARRRSAGHCAAKRPRR